MIAEIVELTFLALTIAIIGRALLSWFPIDPRNPIAEMLVKVTDPILSPIRSIMPRWLIDHPAPSNWRHHRG